MNLEPKTESAHVDEQRDHVEDELWEAHADCHHEIVDAPGGGIKCKHCPGWFCF